MVTGWTVGAIVLIFVTLLIMIKGNPENRGYMFLLGVISTLLIFTQEAVGMTRSYADRAGMGFIGPISAEMAVIYFCGGMLMVYFMDKLWPGSNRIDMLRAAVGLCVMNLVIITAGGSGSILYSVAVLGVVGFVQAKNKKILLIASVVGFGIGALFEFLRYGTWLDHQTALIICFAVSILGLLPVIGGD